MECKNPVKTLELAMKKATESREKFKADGFSVYPVEVIKEEKLVFFYYGKAGWRGAVNFQYDIEIQPEPEYKEGVLGLAWDDSCDTTTPCYYKRKDDNTHDIYHRKAENGYAGESYFDNFTPLPNYERALELAIADNGATMLAGIEYKRNLLDRANKELIK